MWRVPWRLGPAGNSTRRRFFGQKSAIAGLLACGGGHLYPSLSVRRKARPLLCLAERRHDGAESCQQQASSFHRSSLEGGWANWCSTRTISIDSGHVIVRAGNVTVTNIMTATMEQSAHGRPAPSVVTSRLHGELRGYPGLKRRQHKSVHIYRWPRRSDRFGVKPVTDASDRSNQVDLVLSIDRLAQLFDVHVNRPLLDMGVRSPNCVEDLASLKDTSGLIDEKFQ